MAIDKFLQPDITSRTQHSEGRRLEQIRETFGWKITNYEHYRDIKNNEERREYMRGYMAEKRRNEQNVKSGNVNGVNVLTDVSKLTPQLQLQLQKEKQ